MSTYKIKLWIDHDSAGYFVVIDGPSDDQSSEREERFATLTEAKAFMQEFVAMAAAMTPIGASLMTIQHQDGTLERVEPKRPN